MWNTFGPWHGQTGWFPGGRVVFSRCASSCLYPGGLLGQGGLVRASPPIPRKPTGKLPSLAVPRAKCVPHASWLLFTLLGTKYLVPLGTIIQKKNT